MKKHMTLLLAQIFLWNSLFVAPALAAIGGEPQDKATYLRWKASGVDIYVPNPGATDENISVSVDKAFKIQFSYEVREQILKELAERKAPKNVDQVTFKKVISHQLFDDYSYDEVEKLLKEKNIKPAYQLNSSQVIAQKMTELEPKVVYSATYNNQQIEASRDFTSKVLSGLIRTIPTGSSVVNPQGAAPDQSTQRAGQASAEPSASAQERPLSTAPILSPDNNIPVGSTMEADLSHSPADKDNDGKPDPNEVETKVENVRLKDLTPEQRKQIHDAYSPQEMRKLLMQDRKDLVKQMIENYVNPERPQDPRYLGRVQRENQRAGGSDETWRSTVWGSQSHRFPMETVMFFFSIGLINGVMLLNDFSQNPLLMEQHLQTLTDPIGHISFYSFMIVNGYATEFLNNRAMSKTVTADILRNHIMTNPRSASIMKVLNSTVDAKLRSAMLEELAGEIVKVADRKTSFNPYTNTIAKQAYFRMINYLGMTAGSMTSHFTGDFLRTLQSCAKGMYKDAEQVKKQKASTQLLQSGGQASAAPKDRLNGLSEDPCDVAWREWVMEKKFNQYSPALLSMILSTMGSGALTSLAAQAKKTGPYKSIAEIVNKGKVAISKVQFAGAELGATVIGGLVGGMWKSSIRLLHHFSTITIFTALDTAIHSWVEDKTLNFNYGYYYLWPNIDAFPRKAEILDNLITKEGNEGFRKDSVACENDIQSKECRRNDIEGWLYDFSQAMMKWREFNQTKAMQAHSQWVDKVNKFQNMERFSKTYYERFMSDIKNVSLCNANKKECLEGVAGQSVGDEFEAFEAGALSTKLDRLFLNYRQYPLYGVEPDQADWKLADITKWKDYYIQEPDRLQAIQQLRVHRVAAQLEIYLNRRGLDSDHLKAVKAQLLDILKGLKSENFYENGKAIDLMRSMSAASPREVNEIVQAILREHLNLMGSPAPLLYYGQGFPYAFESHSLYKDLVKTVELPEFYRHLRLSTNFYFEKKTDYLFYNMLCGPSPEKQESVVDGTLGNLYGWGMMGFRDLFIPPKIINDNLNLNICSGRMEFNRSSALYNNWIVDQSKNVKYAGGFNVIDKNLSDSMAKIIASDKLSITTEDKNETNRQKVLNQPIYDMSLWWEKYVETQVQAQLDKFKIQYEEIAVKFLESQFKDVGTLLGQPLHSSIVRNSVVESSMQESRTYSLVLSEVFKRNIPADKLASQYAVNPQFSAYKTFSKQQKPEDIVKAQASPFNQDLAALKAGSTPKLFKFQLTNEEILGELYWALKKAEIVDETLPDGKTRKVINLKLDEKQIGELEKKIEESITKLGAEIEELTKLLPEMKNDGKNERPKPLRIIEFSKNHMGKIAREMVGTISTLRYVRNAAESYAKKNKTKEERDRDYEKATREEAKKKCTDSKRAAGITGGDGC